MDRDREGEKGREGGWEGERERDACALRVSWTGRVRNRCETRVAVDDLVISDTGGGNANESRGSRREGRDDLI